MESLIEMMVLEVEEMIRLDYEWLSCCSWSEITSSTKVPNRKHDSFIDMALTRLVLKYGFADGTRLAFEISEYLKGHCNEILQ